MDFLETSDFKVDPSSLAFPARVISVAVPADVSDLNGFLLSRQEPVQFDKDVQELFAFARIYQNVRVNCHPEPMVAFAMVSPKEKNARLHFGVPFDEVTDTLTGTWFKQHLVFTSAKMSDSDAQFQARHLNLGLRLLAYMSAFPEMVRPGLPEGVVQKKDRQPGRSKALTIGLHPRLRTSPSAHLRRGHFRSLSHDRFHRDLDGNVRIIYVNPMIVGHSVTPFTVEHKDA